MNRIARSLAREVAALAGLVVIMLLAFTATAHAADAVASAAGADASLGDLLKPVYQAFHDGHYLAAGALAVIFLVALVKRYAGAISQKFGAFMSGDVGGTIATLVASFAGAVAAASADGSPFAWSTLLNAGKVAAVAAGGYALIKKLVFAPLLASSWYQNKAPAWLKATIGAVSWIFDKPAAADAAIAKSEAAGDAAVKAAPGAGADAIAPPGEKF